MNRIEEFIKSKEINNFHFIPNEEFYNSTGINRKRWGKLVRSEVSPTVEELKRIAKFFSVELVELIEL